MKELIGKKESNGNILLLSILLISSFISLFLFYDARKHDYYRVFLSLKSHPISEAFYANNPYDNVFEVSLAFDPAHNRVFVTTNEPLSFKYEWLKYQVDYYFYPTIPQEIPYVISDMNAVVLSETVSGDVVVSFGDLGLDPNSFSTFSGYDQVAYIRK